MLDSPDMIRIDCHCHTISSWDAMTDHAGLVRDALAAGLDALIVTDHGTLDGLHRLREIDTPLRIVPGVEIQTADGELLAYFLEELPPPGKDAAWTIAFIHDHGGLAVLPHPFAVTAHARVKPPHLWTAAAHVDAIEGLNARGEWPGADAKARELAARLGKPLTAGSDAHLPKCVGRAYLEMPDFDDAADFAAKLPLARPVLRRRSTLPENIWGVVRTFWTTGRVHPALRLPRLTGAPDKRSGRA